MTLDDLGNGSMEAGVAVAFLDGSGHDVTCWDAQCWLVVESQGEYIASAPLTFRPQVSITLTPNSGLIDGQPITVELTGQVPGEVVTVSRCFSECDMLVQLPVPASGRVSTTVVARQQLGDTGYCRRQCSITVDPGFSPTYAMAEGRVTVARPRASTTAPPCRSPPPTCSPPTPAASSGRSRAGARRSRSAPRRQRRRRACSPPSTVAPPVGAVGDHVS